MLRWQRDCDSDLWNVTTFESNVPPPLDMSRYPLGYPGFTWGPLGVLQEIRQDPLGTFSFYHFRESDEDVDACIAAEDGGRD